MTAPYTPTGHPVRNMTLAIVGVTALLLVVWWTGLVTPRLQLTTLQEELEGDIVESIIAIENEGRLPITIVGVDLGERAQLLESDDDIRIGGGDTEEIRVRYRLRECESILNGMRVEVETASGITRSTEETVFFSVPGMLGEPAPCGP